MVFYRLGDCVGEEFADERLEESDESDETEEREEVAVGDVVDVASCSG